MHTKMIVVRLYPPGWLVNMPPQHPGGARNPMNNHEEWNSFPMDNQIPIRDVLRGLGNFRGIPYIRNSRLNPWLRWKLMRPSNTFAWADGFEEIPPRLTFGQLRIIMQGESLQGDNRTHNPGNRDNPLRVYVIERPHGIRSARRRARDRWTRLRRPPPAQQGEQSRRRSTRRRKRRTRRSKRLTNRSRQRKY